MAITTLTPTSRSNKSILPLTGNYDSVMDSLPYGIYSSNDFKEGAKDQVAYVFKK